MNHIETKISQKIAKTGGVNVRERGSFRTSYLDMLWFIVPLNITTGFQVAPVTLPSRIKMSHLAERSYFQLFKKEFPLSAAFELSLFRRLVESFKTSRLQGSGGGSPQERGARN